MDDNDYKRKMEFIAKECPYPNHWCNGVAIKNQGKRDRKPCEWHDVEKGCLKKKKKNG